MSKFGFKSFLLTQKAYAWLMTDVALRKVPNDVELLFANNVDRLAILIDYLPQTKKSLVQHGSLHFYHRSNDPRFSYHEEYGFWTWNCLFRFHTLSRMYCYTEKDKIAYQISNMACDPEYIMIGYAFKPSYKPEGKSLLIIGDPSKYLDKEMQMIGLLQGMDLKIYLKNHPAQPDSLYDEIRRKYDFIFLPGATKDMPAVDVVLSYDSTLAYEYEALGTKVLYYFTFDWDDVRQSVEKSFS